MIIAVDHAPVEGACDDFVERQEATAGAAKLSGSTEHTIGASARRTSARMLPACGDRMASPVS